MWKIAILAIAAAWIEGLVALAMIEAVDRIIRYLDRPKKTKPKKRGLK